MLKINKPTLHKIENIFKDLDYTIRYEKGHFQSGYCIVEKRKIAIINKFFDTSGKINCLIDILMSILVIEDNLSETSTLTYHEILHHVKNQAQAIS